VLACNFADPQETEFRQLQWLTFELFGLRIADVDANIVRRLKCTICKLGSSRMDYSF